MRVPPLLRAACVCIEVAHLFWSSTRDQNGTALALRMDSFHFFPSILNLLLLIFPAILFSSFLPSCSCSETFGHLKRLFLLFLSAHT